MKTLFLDTMIYLHYLPVEDIDWLEVTGVRSVMIVVPEITIRELDKFKNDNTNRKRADKARRVLDKIERWEQGDGSLVRPGVKVEVNLGAPDVNYREHKLDPRWNDHALLATILEYGLRHSDADLVIVTQDTPPRLTAKRLGIKSIALPDSLKATEGGDPQQQRIRDLERQVQRLSNSLPDLRLVFEGGQDGNRLEVALKRPLPFPQDEFDHAMADIRLSLDPNRVMSELDSMRSILASSLWEVSPEELARYQRDTARYVVEYERYLKDKWRYQNWRGCLVEMVFRLVNDGGSPGEDVDMRLHFPDGFTLYREEDLPDAPEEPAGVERPRIVSQLAADLLPVSSVIHSLQPRAFDPRPLISQTQPPPSNVSVPSIRRTQSYDVELHVRRIKHGYAIPVARLFLAFDSYEAASSFQIDYELRPANLPDPIIGKLHVVVEHEG